MQRLSIPLALDMTYLDARLGSMSESELAGRWKAPWAHLDPLEHRAILLPESICWSDRVAPDLAQRIESWKQSRLFQKIARVASHPQFYVTYSFKKRAVVLLYSC
jgi:hypothetical protein